MSQMRDIQKLPVVLLLMSAALLFTACGSHIDHNPDDNSIHSKDQYCNKVFSNLRQFRN